jgi:hypothetical protein
MSEMSYIAVIEYYRQHQKAIQGMLSSILTGIAEQQLFTDSSVQKKAVQRLHERYTFVELLYTIDNHGQQLSDNQSPSKRQEKLEGSGRNRSQRPYYLLAQSKPGEVVITESYLSTNNRSLCISASAPVYGPEHELLGYVVLDIDLATTVEFLMGDRNRRRFSVLFKTVYSFISLGLFCVVGFLLYASFSELQGMFEHGMVEHIQPFGVIIYLTLGLAVFDLAKTTLEEEVLMHKDIFRHSSTRRTITRFVAAILIAVSIEALLMMFKSAIGDGEHMYEAVLMMFSAVGLLVALGAYVYLGAKAEATLNGMKNKA